MIAAGLRSFFKASFGADVLKAKEGSHALKLRRKLNSKLPIARRRFYVAELGCQLAIAYR